MDEVFLWRGTDEQRKLRPLRRKSGQFSYFDQQLGCPDWTGKSVLDFGGNQGDLLAGSDGRIRAEDYCCVDVLEEAVAEGRRRFPQARWVYFDRFNCSFNPQGIANCPLPALGGPFDLILAYSVFTHTTREDMHDLVEQLRALLSRDGRLAFTFIDPHHRSWPGDDDGNNLKWRLQRVFDADPLSDYKPLLERSRGAQWCALVGGRDLFVNDNGSWRDDAGSAMSYHVFHTAQFLQQEFPDSVIQPPVNGEMQHCCIIRPAT